MGDLDKVDMETEDKINEEINNDSNESEEVKEKLEETKEETEVGEIETIKFLDDYMDNSLKDKEEIKQPTSKKTNNKSHKKKKAKLIYDICMFVFATIFIVCAIYLINYFWQSKKSEDKVADLKELVIQDTTEQITEADGTPVVIPPVDFVNIDGVSVQAKFAEIYKLNTDFVGWITIEDTEIDYPVMQTMNDEEYYIHRDFDKEYSSAGTLFIDTNSSLTIPTDNIVIYGHNMKTGKMFHDLLEYEDEDFYKEHKYIRFDTIYENGTYEVIAAYRTEIFPADYTGFKYYYFFDATNEEEFNNYVDNSKALTYYDIPTTAEYGDTLLTLSTCAYHADEGRFVVVAKKIN